MVMTGACFGVARQAPDKWSKNTHAQPEPNPLYTRDLVANFCNHQCSPTKRPKAVFRVFFWPLFWGPWVSDSSWGPKQNRGLHGALGPRSRTRSRGFGHGLAVGRKPARRLSKERSGYGSKGESAFLQVTRLGNPRNRGVDLAASEELQDP